MSDIGYELAHLQKELSDHQERHREMIRHIRNVLAVMRALVRHPPEVDESVDGYHAMLDGRVGAFARAQSMVLHDFAEGVDLESLIRNELMNFGLKAAHEVRIEGPPIRVGSRAAGLVALAIHELARGTVNDDGDGISIDWGPPDADAKLEISWRDAALDNRHLGWLKEAFGYELKGSLDIHADKQGRHCIMCLPSTLSVQ